MSVASKQLELSPWNKAVAGALAGVIANAAVYPLDIVKTKIQVQPKQKPENVNEDHYYESTLDALRKIAKTEGFGGLYRGLVACLIGCATANFAYFYWYSVVRDIYNSKIRSAATKQTSTATELLLGAVAGNLATLFVLPIAVVTTRQQTQKHEDKKSLFETAKDVLTSNGITGFWKGLNPSIILSINPSITYGSFERIKAILYPNVERLNSGQNFLLGAISKSLATFATQPLIISKVMIQSTQERSKSIESSSENSSDISFEDARDTFITNEKLNEKNETSIITNTLKSSNKKKIQSNQQFNSFTQALIYLYKVEGIPGLFKGIGPQLGKAVIVQGLLFMIKDKVETFMILIILKLIGLKKILLKSKTS